MQETHNINFENSVNDYLSSQTARDILVFFFLFRIHLLAAPAAPHC